MRQPRLSCNPCIPVGLWCRLPLMDSRWVGAAFTVPPSSSHVCHNVLRGACHSVHHANDFLASVSCRSVGQWLSLGGWETVCTLPLPPPPSGFPRTMPPWPTAQGPLFCTKARQSMTYKPSSNPSSVKRRTRVLQACSMQTGTQETHKENGHHEVVAEVSKSP
jgi:hypothetical protein